MLRPLPSNDIADPDRLFLQQIRVNDVVADSGLQRIRVSDVADQDRMGRHAAGAGVAKPASTGGVAPRPPSLGFMTSTPNETGMQTRREVLGDEHVDRAIANTTEFTAPFQDLITRYAWGEIWSRPGLSRPERSMITLAMLAALRQEEELAMHVRAAVRNGLTAEQIQEVLLQVAVYAGVPAANRAFAVAAQVLAGIS
jgi:4-carboxymuconolactone decarboxylase